MSVRIFRMRACWLRYGLWLVLSPSLLQPRVPNLGVDSQGRRLSTVKSGEYGLPSKTPMLAAAPSASKEQAQRLEDVVISVLRVISSLDSNTIVTKAPATLLTRQSY